MSKLSIIVVMAVCAIAVYAQSPQEILDMIKMGQELAPIIQKAVTTGKCY